MYNTKPLMLNGKKANYVETFAYIGEKFQSFENSFEKEKFIRERNFPPKAVRFFEDVARYYDEGYPQSEIKRFIKESFEFN